MNMDLQNVLEHARCFQFLPCSDVSRHPCKTPLPFFVSACSDSFHDAHEVWWHLPLLVLGLVALGVGGRLAFSWNSSRKARKIERTLEEVYAQLWDAWYSKHIMCQGPLTAKRKPPLG